MWIEGLGVVWAYGVVISFGKCVFRSTFHTVSLCERHPEGKIRPPHPLHIRSETRHTYQIAGLSRRRASQRIRKEIRGDSFVRNIDQRFRFTIAVEASEQKIGDQIDAEEGAVAGFVE